jgi:hypothetical protein
LLPENGDNIEEKKLDQVSLFFQIAQPLIGRRKLLFLESCIDLPALPSDEMAWTEKTLTDPYGYAIDCKTAFR